MSFASSAEANAEPPTSSIENSTSRPPGGGAATGGGINFQAAITAIAGAHLLRGTAMGWLGSVTQDTPIAVWAETNGPGDDVRLELATGEIVEVQAKKGLQRSNELWTPLLNLALAVAAQTIDFGVLAVAPDASGTIRNDLSQDIGRLADGRHDHLSDIGQEWLGRLNDRGLPVSEVCARLRIRVVHALEVDGVSITAAVEVLRYVCAQDADGSAAWLALYHNAVAIIERRGRWRLQQLMRLLIAANIKVRDGVFPAGTVARLAPWVAASNSTFEIAGLLKRLPLSALLPLKTVAIAFEQHRVEHAAMALERYRTFGERLSKPDDTVFEAEWTGRFFRHAVVVAGPGLGKSTLITKLANVYATDCCVILKVSLKSVAAAMRSGTSFEDSVFKLGLDGSNVSSTELGHVDLQDLILLADGLDECGDQHHQVAAGLVKFVNGYPALRVVVTTRPIGYETTELADWRHYFLLAPDISDGRKSLAALLKSGSDNTEITVFAEEIANRELSATAAADTISASPHMLGMAASVILQKGSLPQSRTQLYDRMISLLENSPRKPGSQLGQGAAVRARVLDTLGWNILQDPIAHEKKLVQSCSESLSPELGTTVLMASTYVEPALLYWEEVGLVERLFHDGTTLRSFIHKTFAEFAAARYLVALPTETMRDQLASIVDDPAWGEVVSFAAGLGAGNAIAAMLAGRRAQGLSGQFERALALISHPDADISDNYAVELITEAFRALEERTDDGLSLGVAIANLAAKRPSLVGPIARSRLTSDHPTAKLAAWAAVTSAGSGYFDPRDAASAVPELLPHVGQHFAPSLLGGFRLGSDHGRDLIQRVAHAALKELPIEAIEEFVETVLDHPIFQNVGFLAKIDASLPGKGILPDWTPPWRRSSMTSMMNLVLPPKEWEAAAQIAYRSIAEAVTTIGEEVPTECVKVPWPGAPRLLQFSALIRGIGFNDVPAYDIHEWSKDYDRAAVREALRVFTAISAIDPSELANEAAALISRLDTEPDFSPFKMHLPVVDVPDPAWHDAISANPNRALLEKLFSHGSIWLVYLAANILHAIPIDEAGLVSLLATSRGDALAAVAHLVRVQHAKRAVDILIDRLDGEWVPGVHALFKTLKASKPSMSDRLMSVVSKGLTNSSVIIAEAATDLAADLVARGQMKDPALIEQAYAYWEINEQRSPANGIIPGSPREALLRILLTLSPVKGDWLLERLHDSRNDVRALVEGHVVAILRNSPEMQERLVSAILAHTIPANFAARILNGDLELRPEQVASLSALLVDADGKWRLVGMALLDRSVMSDSEILVHANRLASDQEAEISARARGILESRHDLKPHSADDASA